MSLTSTASAPGVAGPSSPEILQYSPCWRQHHDTVAGTASPRRMIGVKEKHVRQDNNNDSPLFLTFEIVTQEATEALLLAASDLAVVAEADGRYEDVFAMPLTSSQLQQQQMLEDHMRELVRDTLQVDALLKTFAAAFEGGPGKHIIPAVPAPQLSARSSADSFRRAAAAAESATAAATAEAREHLGGTSSKSSSQTATRCTSAAVKHPAAGGSHGSAATPLGRGAAGTNAEAGRPAARGAQPMRSAAAEMTLEACQPQERKTTSSSAARRQQCGPSLGNAGTSNVCSASSAVATSGMPHGAASPGGTGAAAGAAGSGAASSAGVEASNVLERGNLEEQQRGGEGTGREQQCPITGEAAVLEEGKREAANVERKEKVEEEEGNDDSHQQTLQHDSLCDFFMNIVRFCYREECSAAETSTLLGIMKVVLQRAVLENQTALDSFRHFKRLLLKYSVQRPPLSIRVFTFRTLQSANRFVVNTFYRHYQIYVQCFIPEVHPLTVQQPVPVTAVGRLNLATSPAAAAVSPRLAAAAGRQQSLWSLDLVDGDTPAPYGIISSNESSQLDVFPPVLPEETND